MFIKYFFSSKEIYNFVTCKTFFSKREFTLVTASKGHRLHIQHHGVVLPSLSSGTIFT